MLFYFIFSREWDLGMRFLPSALLMSCHLPVDVGLPDSVSLRLAVARVTA